MNIPGVFAGKSRTIRLGQQQSVMHEGRSLQERGMRHGVIYSNAVIIKIHNNYWADIGFQIAS